MMTTSEVGQESDRSVLEETDCSRCPGPVMISESRIVIPLFCSADSMLFSPDDDGFGNISMITVGGREEPG